MHLICLDDVVRKLDSEVMASEMCPRMLGGHQETSSTPAVYSSTQVIVFGLEKCCEYQQKPFREQKQNPSVSKSKTLPREKPFGEQNPSVSKTLP